MRRLKIRAFRQPHNKPWCGPVCARMVLDFYGIRKGRKEIVEEMNMVKGGVRPAGVGLFFLRHGFKVRFRFWLPRSEPQWLGHRKRDQIEKIIHLKKFRKVCKKNLWSWKEVVEFFEAGGDIVLEPAWKEDIVHAINSRTAMIVGLNFGLLTGLGRSEKGHFVVPITISGRKKEFLRFLDPWDARTWDAPLDSFMFANHLWESAILFVEKQK